MSFPTTQCFSRQARQTPVEMACWCDIPDEKKKWEWNDIDIEGVKIILGFIFLVIVVWQIIKVMI